MTLKIVAISIGVWLFLPLFGCHAALIKMGPGVTFPLSISDKAPAFLFPINLSHLNAEGTSSQMGAVVADGVIAKFGAALVSGQQLTELVGDLSSEFADTIDDEVRHGTFMMSDGGTAMAAQVASVMKKVILQLVDRGLLKNPITFKYIIVVHSHGEPDVGGTMLKVNSWGGIYDTETEQIAAYVSATETYVNGETILCGQLPIVYGDIIEKLIQGAKK